MLLPVEGFEDIAAVASAFIGQPALADAGELTLMFLCRSPLESTHENRAEELPPSLEDPLALRVDG